MHSYDSDITTITVSGCEYSAFIIGDENASIPKHLLQGERLEGKIIDGREITPFMWKGVIKDDRYMYVYFDKREISHIDSLSGPYRPDALKLVEMIAWGLEKSDKKFLNLENGVFPLYRIYVVDGSKILLLPPDMGDLIAISRLGEKRRREVLSIIKRDTPDGFKLIQEMAELLYMAATGFLPFEREEVRASGFKEIPLEWYEDSLDEKTRGFISFILDASEKNMREISGNKTGSQNLAWFLARVRDLSWGLAERDESENLRVEEKSERIQTFFLKARKEARKKNFWKMKGPLIITIALVAAIALSIAAYYISIALKPPTTAGLPPEEVIETFFRRMSDLDFNNLDDGVKGEIPQSSEVLNLFVTRQTRMAYEQMNPHIKAEDWVNAGKPEIMDTAFIYGVILDEIERIDEDTYRAKGHWYTPYSYEEDGPEVEIEEKPGYTNVFIYEVWEDFDAKWNKRGFYTLSNINIPYYEFEGVEEVKTYEKAPVHL